MRILPECISCIVDDVLQALNLLEISRKDANAIISEALKYLGEHYIKNEPASYYITEMHRIIKRYLHLDMPFSTLREICLLSCKEIARKIGTQAMAYSGVEKMRFLIRWTIAANTLDFRAIGAGYGFATNKIEQMLEKCFWAGLAVDDIDRIFHYVKNSTKIVYLPDNVGELPFDKMLIAECRSYGCKVTVPFRSGPITSDVVIADANAVQMSEVTDQIILSGPDTLGISFQEMTNECKIALENADIIIAKGQANFYVLSEFGMDFPHAAIICLFVTKCRHISRLFKQTDEDKIMVATVLKEKNTIITVGRTNS